MLLDIIFVNCINLNVFSAIFREYCESKQNKNTYRLIFLRLHYIKIVTNLKLPVFSAFFNLHLDQLNIFMNNYYKF